MHNDIPELDKKGLRNFGFMFAGFIGGIFGVLLPLLRDSNFPLWPWMVVSPFVLISLIAPGWLNGFYRVWMRIGMAIGSVVNRVILALVYFGVVLPIALILRVAGKDPLSRKLNSGQSSYRIESKPSKPKDLERPF